MLPFVLSLLLGVTGADSAAEAPPESTGTIQGVVVDGSHRGEPLKGVKVILRAGTRGGLFPVAETKTDQDGKFAFEDVPLDPAIVYLPGANRKKIHYPGDRVRLNELNRNAYSKIVAFDAVEAPNPLVAKRHHIDILVEEKALKVTEEMLLSNGSRTTYVGQPRGEMPPVTFWLSIPQDFDRVTFDKEFFGRRFLVVDHRPVTDIPWLPGEQELRFTYHVPLTDSACRFRRPLDVPSSDVRVSVRGASAGQVTCNLPPVQTADDEVAFASADGQLPTPFTLELDIGALPIPWAQYARWLALLLLIMPAVAVAVMHRLRSRRAASQPTSRRKANTRRRAA